jgi:hypothetical protein
VNVEQDAIRRALRLRSQERIAAAIVQDETSLQLEHGLKGVENCGSLVNDSYLKGS